MRGLSEQQRDVLRLALAVNIHTQGGTAKVKGGSPVKGYRVPTVDYAGPKDLRPPLLLWALGGARLSADVAGFFKHGASSKVAKASLARAVARLVKRGMLMYAPLPKWVYGSTLPDWGYVLTQAGMDAAGAEPLDVPLLAEACELFGITHRANYHSTAWGAYWGREDAIRKRALIDRLATVTCAQICAVVTDGG